MRIKTTFAPELLICVFDRWPAFEERAAARDQLRAAGYLQNNTSCLIDFRRLEALPDADALAATIAEHMHPGNRIALVVASSTHATAIQAAAGRLTRKLDFAGFLSETDALNWLYPSVAFPLRVLD